MPIQNVPEYIDPQILQQSLGRLDGSLEAVVTSGEALKKSLGQLQVMLCGAGTAILNDTREGAAIALYSAAEQVKKIREVLYG